MRIIILGACILVPVLILWAVSEVRCRSAEKIALRKALEAEKRLRAAKEAGTFKPRFKAD